LPALDFAAQSPYSGRKNIVYSGKQKMKLKPVKNDAIAFIALFEKDEKEFNTSNIATNGLAM
jgi:hypothetical protein